uniref:CSON001443 protein n=1 Tax=Culicoides sonorensis TaxID=179676 RepID=A0A336K5T2_CULSO
MFVYEIKNSQLKAVIKETKSKVVYLTEYRPNGLLLIIKQFKELCQKELLQLQNEIAGLRQLCHQNILKVELSFVDDLEIVIVQKCMKFGSCKDVMDRFLVVGFPELVVSLIVRDMLLAIDYLHKKGYIHRSIKASHILLDDRAVLMGFKECVNIIQNGKRLSKLFDLPLSPKELIWAAPEMLEQNLCGYNQKSDIYSLGITMCELGNNITPYAEMGYTLILTEKLKGNQPSLLDCSTYTVDTDMNAENLNCFATRKFYASRKLSDPFHNFVEICLQKDPHSRPEAEKLLSHPFIKQSKHTSLKQELNEELKIDPLSRIQEFSEEKNEFSLITDKMKNMNISDVDWNF